MEAITSLTTRAVPLKRSNVDTDQIIPSDWLKRVERTGFGAGLFAEWRDDRDFVLNQPQYAGAEVLIAGENFGIGSSREHAVWALQDYGFKAVVAPSFGDIFRNNATKAGLIPVKVEAADAAVIMDAVIQDPTVEITIDVENLVVELPAKGVKCNFELDQRSRQRFINGWDDIDLTLRFEKEITTYEASRHGWMPITVGLAQ
ncbi:MAG: 3-isopropylmalate dehydratase small subunit [Actinobacteria bacterium]|jgi:3-isopropylmalate/(R)-2-methylmalate dehydratase small subunit|nr:3-isopropylmalate dehydratase small subunit [Actinomycetota bacterium]MCL6095894.1 3-isopropylmalate dehydratase small subunit [Actinomycetota bacterium]